MVNGSTMDPEEEEQVAEEIFTSMNDKKSFPPIPSLPYSSKEIDFSAVQELKLLFRGSPTCGGSKHGLGLDAVTRVRQTMMLDLVEEEEEDNHVATQM